MIPTVSPGRAPRAGVTAGLALVVLVTAALLPLRRDISRAGPALLLVLPVVVAAVVGRRRAAVVTALGAALAFNVGFIPPFGTLKVSLGQDAIALAVFLVVAVTAGNLVAAEGERRGAAERRAAEVDALNRRLQALLEERARLAEEATRVTVLERVDEQRAALLRAVSHDLRTPLATIRAVASDLRDGADHAADLRDELLDTVLDEVERLDRLVGNLLSLGRIEAGALVPDLQAVDVEELIGACVRRLGRMLRQVRIQVDTPPDLPLVRADYSQLDQVLTNLLENAVRYAPPTSTVRVWAAGTPGGLELGVSDEGIGVAGWDRDRIFQPFARGEGSSSTGVGLAICRALVEAHGGDIRVTDSPGGGATFIVRLPLDRAPQ